MANPNTAKFPTELATDTDLLVLTNRASATLTAYLGAADLSIATTTQAIQAPCAVSIESELILISVATPTVLTVAPGGRGFDNTSAAAHASGTDLAVNMIDWPHNQTAAEVKAIEAFLGTNGSNVVSTGVVLEAAAFDWSQTPGVDLAVGSNVITLTPVPKGVNGSDANHYVYISNGSGAPEACLITGGTATSEATSGTIIFACANTHTTTWTVSSDSGGVREAIIYSGGNAVILLPYDTVIPIAGAGGLVVDQAALSIVGGGYGSVLQARANAALNALMKVTAGNACRFSNFSLDGNRTNAGTNPTLGTALQLGVNGTGGASYVSVTGVEVLEGARYGIVVSDTNVDIEISRNFIHDNGGVTDATGGGTGVFVDWVSAHTQASGVRIVNNYIADNHNTVTNCGVGGAAIWYGSGVIFQGNYCLNNYNNGGQAVAAGLVGPSTIANNEFILTSTGLVQTTSGVEATAWNPSITGNTVIDHTKGYGVVLKGMAAGAGGVGASDAVVADNYISNVYLGIGVLNNTGHVRGAAITGNRVAAGSPAGSTGKAISVESAAVGTLIAGNNCLDSATPVDDQSTDGASIYGNSPEAANLLYAGTIASATAISMRPGQTATITGAVTINTITLPTSYAGAAAAGIKVTLIPAAGATWHLGTSDNINAAFTAVVGIPVTLTSNGTKFFAK